MDKRANNGPKGVWVGSDLAALAFFAKRVLGENSDGAVFATSQPKERKNRVELTGAQTLQLTELTTASRLRKLRALPVVLMGYAESETHFSPSKRVAARVRSANLAAAISIQLDLLLHPAELVSLVCEAGKTDLVITSSNGSERSTLVSDLTDLSRNMLERRATIQVNLNRSSKLLFPGNDLTTVQLDRSVCSSLGKILANQGFKDVTMQVLRDVGAIAMLRDDPTKVRRVMILLGYNSVRSVHRRYAPFLKGVR